MKYDKIVGLKKQQEKENLEIIQREIDAMLRRKERPLRQEAHLPQLV